MKKLFFVSPRQWGLALGAVAISCLAALSATPALAAAVSAPSIPVANFTGFNDVGTFMEANLKEELKQEIRARKLAVFALTLDFPGQKACYAMVGLTHAAPTGMSPRFPNARYMSFAVEPSAGEMGCVEGALKRASASLSAAPLEAVLDGLSATESQGKRPMGEAVDPDTVQLSSSDVPGASKDAVFEILQANQFGRAFDHRQVATYVMADGAQLEDGSFMCVAVAGLTARSPADRNVRWPINNQGYVRLQNGGDIDGCKSVVVPQAVGALMASSWTNAGLLKDFAVTREEGVPLPDAKKAAKARATFLAQNKPKAVRTQVARTTSHNVVRCTNQCVNGSCVRTFENGRKERWQAPRAFDPINNNWGWDTSTNACGL